MPNQENTPKKFPFRCRMPGCEGRSFRPHRSANDVRDIRGGGAKYYSCTECSTLFMDPAKFSLKPPAESKS